MSVFRDGPSPFTGSTPGAFIALPPPHHHHHQDLSNNHHLHTLSSSSTSTPSTAFPPSVLTLPSGYAHQREKLKRIGRESPLTEHVFRKVLHSTPMRGGSDGSGRRKPKTVGSQVYFDHGGRERSTDNDASNLSCVVCHLLSVFSHSFILPSILSCFLLY